MAARLADLLPHAKEHILPESLRSTLVSIPLATHFTHLALRPVSLFPAQRPSLQNGLLPCLLLFEVILLDMGEHLVELLLHVHE